MPHLSWTAARLGLVPVPDARLETAVRAYLTASEYLGPIEQARGAAFDPHAWTSALLHRYPGELYVQFLASLNRATRFTDAVLECQQRFLSRLSPGLRQLIGAVLAGGTDGQPRRFLARQPVLRAMRLVLTAEPRKATRTRSARAGALVPEAEQLQHARSFRVGASPPRWPGM